MKRFSVFIAFCIAYILVAFLFYGISSSGHSSGIEPPVQTIEESPQDDSEVKFPQQRQRPNTNGGSGNPFVDIFQVNDPETKAVLDAAYGSYSGNDQCMRKSACIAGNSLKDVALKNFLFIFTGSYIPEAYSLYYEIFKNAALYGQNCDVYFCILQSQQPVQNQPRAV